MQACILGCNRLVQVPRLLLLLISMKSLMMSTSTILGGDPGRYLSVTLVTSYCCTLSECGRPGKPSICRQGNLEGVSAATLDSFRAELWMLAPPCQPFTRRGLQQDIADVRTKSFQHVLRLLPQLKVMNRKGGPLSDHVLWSQGAVATPLLCQILCLSSYSNSRMHTSSCASKSK
jgi:hypothetical protein